MKERDLSIETLRGFAILLVVMGYIITTDLPREMHTNIVASGLRFFHYIFTPIRMPLFTVISAYLYAASPASRATFGKLVHGKFRRVFIPFVTVSTLQFLIFSMLPMTNHPYVGDLYKVYIWPHEQLWFLYSIFEIFMIVGVLDALGALRTFRRWSVCFALSLILNIFVNPTHAFSLYGINYLMPFFFMGYAIRRFPEALFSRKTAVWYAAVSVVFGLFWTLLYVHPVLPGLLHKCVGLVVSFSAVPLIFYLRKPMPFIAWVGSYAFGIHIFNRIVVSSLRSGFEQAHFQNTPMQFLAYVLGGIAFSIVLQLVLERFDVTRKYILGMKKRKVAVPDVLELKPSSALVGLALKPDFLKNESGFIPAWFFKRPTTVKKPIKKRIAIRMDVSNDVSA